LTATVDISRAEAIPGYMADVELRWLAHHAAKADVIVEVGSYKGRSTRALADHCPGVVYAVDPWDGGYENDDGSQAKWIDTAGAFRDFQDNMRDHIETGRVVPVKGIFGRVSMPERIVPDLVFIDGDHRYSAVKADIDMACRMLRHQSGGVLCGHDYRHKDWPGVKKAVDEIFAGVHVEVCRSIWAVRL
jgi:Methyltransferase domain